MKRKSFIENRRKSLCGTSPGFDREKLLEMMKTNKTKADQKNQKLHDSKETDS